MALSQVSKWLIPIRENLDELNNEIKLLKSGGNVQVKVDLSDIERRLDLLESKYPSLSRSDLSDIHDKKITELEHQFHKLDTKINMISNKLKATFTAVSESD